MSREGRGARIDQTVKDAVVRDDVQGHTLHDHHRLLLPSMAL